MNVLKVLVLLLFTVQLHNSFAQEITILDKLTQERIPGAQVVGKNCEVKKLSNSDGRFQLDDFKACDTILISYPNYVTREFTYSDLSKVVWIELSEVELDISGMVVTANRWEQDKCEVPFRINDLKMRDVELQSPQTAADLLETSGYVFVQKSQLAGGSPQLRGFGTKRVMIVVDGVRMNTAIFRSGNLQNVISVDANSLSGVEVMFGPGAVMYGSDAIGGVMDFKTKVAQFAPDSMRNLVKTNIYTRFSSAANEVTNHLDFNYGSNKFAALTSVSYSRFEDLLVGKYGDSTYLRPTYQENGVTYINENPRLQVHSGYDQINAIQKFAWKPKQSLKLDYTFNYSTNLSDAPRYDRLILDENKDGNLDYEEWYYGPQEWMMNRVSLNVNKKRKCFDEFKIIGAWQHFEESRHDRKFGSSTIRHQLEEVDAYSLNFDFDKSFGSRTMLFYGGEGVFNSVKSNAYKEADDGSVKVINPRYPDGSTWQTYGVYANLKHFMTEKWILNAGIRYTHYLIHAEFDTTLFPYPVTSTNTNNGALNGSLGVVFHPDNLSQIYINASTGFRAPNIDDIGKIFDSEPGLVIVPNPSLAPEYAYSGELGFVKAFKGTLKLDGAVYYTNLQQAMARTDYTFNGQQFMVYEDTLSRIQAVQNVSDAHVYGVQGGVEVALVKGLTLFSSISYQKGVEYNIDSSAYFPKAHVAPLFGRTELRYKQRQMRLVLYAVYHGEVKYDDFPLGERGDAVYALDENGNTYTPAWYTLNFKGAYYFNKHLALNVGVENITNQLYRTFGSGISASGLNVMVALKASF